MNKLKIAKVTQVNPATKAKGFGVRALHNGTASFEDIVAAASKNTTLAPEEAEMAFKIFIREVADYVKNGYRVDLKNLGCLAPSASAGWFEKAEDIELKAVKTGINYQPSDDIKAAIGGASLSWAKATDEDAPAEDNTQTPANPTPGGNELEG